MRGHFNVKREIASFTLEEDEEPDLTAAIIHTAKKRKREIDDRCDIYF